MADYDDDRNRRNPAPLPSNYVTLVQLEERWLQEKQRKQNEKEEQERKQKMQKQQEEDVEGKRKREEEEQQQQQKSSLQKRPIESIPTFPRRNHRLLLKSSTQYRAIGVRDGESERTDDLNLKKKHIPTSRPQNHGLPLKSSMQFRAIGVSDVESERADDLKNKKKKKKKKKKKMTGKPRAEEALIGGKEQLLKEKVALSEDIPVVSTERSCEKQIGGKCEDSASGGKRGIGKYLRGVKNRGKPRVEADQNIGREQLPIKEDLSEDIPVVSTERSREKEIGGRCEVPASGGKRLTWKNCTSGKNWGKATVEADQTIGREQLPIKEEVAENAPVVSIKRDGELTRNGKDLVVNDRVWEKKVVEVDGSEGVLGKFEGLSVGGGRGGYGKNAGYMNGGPRKYSWGSERVNSWRLQRPRDSNLVWVRKEEGDPSDANVAGA